MIDTLKTAQILFAQGIAAIPCDHSKKPLCQWKEYQEHLPPKETIDRWFAKDAQIALIGGRINCIDIDEKHAKGIFQRLIARAEETGLDHLLGELICQETPSGGFHLVFQCETTKPIRNLKLAQNARNEVMIETRGEGGYFLISPSKGYKLIRGDWSSIPKVSEEDRDALMSLAQSFHEQAPKQEPKEETHKGEYKGDTGKTPGDDYDFRADIPALLRAHGWTQAGTSGKYWTRPGKTKGISATWDIVPDRFYVFSTSTQFQNDHVYRPWHLYAMLECGGDYSRAAAELRRQGFGGSTKPTKTLTDEMDEYRPGVEYLDKPSHEDPPAIEGIDPSGTAPTLETEDEKLWRLLTACKFNENEQPPEIVPIYSLADVIICTSGNITAITAQAKVGKSALVTAMMAAAMTDPSEEKDCLTASGYNAKGRAVIYFDTEQSKADFWWSVDRAKKRAGVAKTPGWLSAHTITTFGAKMKRRALLLALANYASQFGGIHSVIIDGVADLVLDVNDAAECNEFVAVLHELAIRYDCAIVCVIHKNPGSDKTRGHLGSQIERKAETNLTLEKDGDVTVVWSAKQRRAPINKATGPRFHWDDKFKMHVTCGDEPKASSKVVELLELAESVLKPGDSMQWKQLLEALSDARSTPNKSPSKPTVERWISSMKKEGILTFSFGQYRLNPANYLKSSTNDLQKPTINHQ